MLANSTPRLPFGQRRDDTQETPNTLDLGRHWAWILKPSEVLMLWFLMAIRMLMVVVVLVNEK